MEIIGYNYSDIINDKCFSTYELNLIQQFHDICIEQINSSNVQDHEIWNIQTIADICHIDLSSFHKEGPVIQAFWIIFLAITKRNLKESDYKYADINEFLFAYNGLFDNQNELEQELLWKTANWMSFLFKIIPARKNKGLVIQVIPKLVEGWDVKYITGSGQTKATAHRVRIFETEGDIQAFHRGRPKVKKQINKINTNKPTNLPSKKIISNEIKTERKPIPFTNRKRRSNQIYSTPNEVFEDPINASKYKSRMDCLRRRESMDSHDTDNEDSDSHSDSHSDSQSDDQHDDHNEVDKFSNNRSMEDMYLYDWIGEQLFESLKVFRDNSLSLPNLTKQTSFGSYGMKTQSYQYFNNSNNYNNNLSLVHPDQIVYSGHYNYMTSKFGPCFDKFTNNYNNQVAYHNEDDILDMLVGYSN